MEPQPYSRHLQEIPCGKKTWKVAVILNPMSGRGRGKQLRWELDRTLEKVISQATPHAQWAFEYDIVATTAPGAATALARQAAEEGATVVAAAGGDGTLNEIVNGIVGTRALLGVIPFGTGNDFARCIGIGTDAMQAVPHLFAGVHRPLDLGTIGDRWFVNIAGCGFDALVAQRINTGFRYLRGTAAYIAAVCDCLRNLKAADLNLTLDGQSFEARALMCSVANATSYGGGMRVAPDAQIDDGLFDICLLREAGRLEFLRAFPRVFRGTHVTHPKVTILRAAEVTVESDPPLPILIDGDVVGTTPATFKVHRHAINVLAPRERMAVKAAAA